MNKLKRAYKISRKMIFNFNILGGMIGKNCLNKVIEPNKWVILFFLIVTTRSQHYLKVDVAT